MADSLVLPVSEKETNKTRFDAKINTLSENTNIDAWHGYAAISTLFYIYIFNKYKMNCFLQNEGKPITGFVLQFVISPQKKIRNFDFQNFFSRNLFSRNLYARYDSDKIVKQLFQCIENELPIIIIPLTLKFFNDDGTKNSGHVNILIYRKKFNTIEHFEPHGSWYNNNQEMAIRIKKAITSVIDKPLNSLIKKKYPKDAKKVIQFISSEDTCPLLGFQALEEKHHTIFRPDYEKNGYCVAWTLFFTELALCNPDVASTDLIDKMYAKFGNDKVAMGNYFLEMIRGYTRIINKKIVTLAQKLFGIDMTVKDLHNKHIWDKYWDEVVLLAEVEMELLNNPHLSIQDYADQIFNEVRNDGWRVSNKDGIKNNLGKKNADYENAEWLYNIKTKEKVQNHPKVKKANLAKKLMKLSLSPADPLEPPINPPPPINLPLPPSLNPPLLPPSPPRKLTRRSSSQNSSFGFTTPTSSPSTRKSSRSTSRNSSKNSSKNSSRGFSTPSLVPPVIYL
jgi:hypothetical protein